jgi:myo-inositol-1(or 4)-monophosphatase
VGSKQSALSSLSSDTTFGKVTPDVLQGRKYLIVRSVGDYNGESGKEAQKRIVESFYETIDEWDAA